MMDTNMTLVLMLASAIAKTPYDSLRYNCWDYSTDLYFALAKQNITSQIVIGMAFNEVHTWVSIDGTWIESSVGYEITDRSPYRMSYISFPKFNPYKEEWLKEHE
jgi:hypothetical protein